MRVHSEHLVPHTDTPLAGQRSIQHGYLQAHQVSILDLPVLLHHDPDGLVLVHCTQQDVRSLSRVEASSESLDGKPGGRAGSQNGLESVISG